MLNAFRGSEERAELEILKGRDRLVLRPSEMPCQTWNSNEPYSAEMARPLTYLWSDRGIYRPGEKLSFPASIATSPSASSSRYRESHRVDLTNGSEDSPHRLGDRHRLCLRQLLGTGCAPGGHGAGGLAARSSTASPAPRIRAPETPTCRSPISGASPFPSRSAARPSGVHGRLPGGDASPAPTSPGAG